MQWGHALLGHHIGLSPVAEERGCNLRLVLLGGDVQGSVAVLQSERNGVSSAAAPGDAPLWRQPTGELEGSV